MKKRILSLLLAVMMILTLMPTAALADTTATSGICGENLTWTLDNGVLTISGTGAMTDYSSKKNSSGDYVTTAPWRDSYKSITSVVIESGVTTIGESAFNGCRSLTSVTIPDSVTTISFRSFCGCSSLTSVTIPNSVTKIGISAFEDCSSLNAIKIPQSITQIKTGTFLNCSALASVELPNSITEIGNISFAGCGLTNIVIPESVNTIVAGAFENCAELETVSLPESLTRIEMYVFYGCTSLKTINLDNVLCVDEYAFEGCENIESITMANTGWPCEIGESAFKDCTALKDVTLSANLKSIGKTAFQNCTSLETINIPDKVETIGISAFSGCSALKTVSLPVSLTTIGNAAFRYCTAIKDVYYPGDEVQWNAIAIDIYNECLTGATLHLNEHIHSYTTVTVIDPTCTEQGYTKHSCACGESYEDAYTEATGHSYNEKTHKCASCGETDPAYREHEHNYENGICRDCFAIDPDYKHATSGYCGGEGDGTNLKWKLKDNVLTISGKGAMRDYENNYFESLIPWYAQRMTIKQLVIEKGVTTIGYDSFSEFYGLTSVVIPDGVTVIGGCAFWCCTNLSDVTIPDSVQTIGQRAFINCSSLTSIDIPANVTTIEQSAFAGCSSLTSVELPSSLTTIGSWVFDCCSSLTSVTIPASVTAIEYGAFWYCDNLTDVYYNGTQEQWNAISIDNENEWLTNATIHFKEDTCEHSYTEKVVDPTCTERGYTLHTCSLCGYSYKDTYVAAKGHKTETRNVIEATCSQAGYTGDKYCTVCQKFVERGEETPLANHKYILGTCIVCGQSQSGSGLGSLLPSLHTHDYTDEVIAPTCTDMGYTRHTCKDCGFSYKNQYKFSTGHTTELQNAKAATCTTAGYSGDKYCTVCKQTVEKGTEVKALGHNYVGGVCANCGATNAMYNPFKDVDKETHSDYYDAILWAYYNDITKGTNAAGDMFSPELGCTRAQIVTFLWRQSGAPVVEVANPFVDVDREKHADYYNAILWGYSTGVVKGVSDTEFAPDKICSRAEIVTMLYRLDGENAVTTGTQFTDLTQDWYKDAIAWAVAEKITKGTSDTTFTPDAPCTRAQTVTFLYRYFA